MIHSFLIGLVTGARSMTPLSAVSLAARAGRLPRDSGAPDILSSPVGVAGSFALAVGEIMGDKIKSAPDRIVTAGMAARLATGGLAGAALAPHARRGLGAALGAAGAVVGAHLTFRLRMAALGRFGQTPSGLMEDALAGAAAGWVIDHARRTQPLHPA